VLAGVLPEHEHPRRPVEAAAVEDRSPFHSEELGRVGVRAGVVPGQRREGLVDGTGIEVVDGGAGPHPLLDEPARGARRGLPPRAGPDRRYLTAQALGPVPPGCFVVGSGHLAYLIRP
jgi:hypothetical protein